MVTPRLVLVLGDQLSHGIAALRQAERSRDVVVMAEVAHETGHVPHHPQKIALVLAAMRRFAAALSDAGWRVAYGRLDDPQTAPSIPGELLRRACETGAQEVIATTPGDWRLRTALGELPLGLTLLADDRFLCPAEVFASWADGRKSLRMEYFYREMRRRTGYLMEGDAPAGGRWNFDHDNRKRAPGGLVRPPLPDIATDPVTEAVLDLVAVRFAGNFGRLRPFRWATDRDGALAVLEHFLKHRLPLFGDYQDAMSIGDPVLWHATISPYLNLGLLDPREVCDAVQAEWRAGRVPLNAAEGFIRQIIGWREYVRGIWEWCGPEYLDRNELAQDAPLPPVYWGGDTRMACMAAAVGQTRELAYAHHIQRLMVTGNFALLAGVDPQDVHRWYLAVYADAVEWVEAPNTLGMSQFADGGLLASKPYVSSGAYIDRMSDYCGSCAYKVKDRTGPKACPFNPLYWHFLVRHRGRLSRNPRMAQMYRSWDRMETGHRARVLADAESLLLRLRAGEPV